MEHDLCSYECECLKCDEKENCIDNVKYWLMYLLEDLYQKPTFNADEFERTLQELCASVNIRIPTTNMNIPDTSKLSDANEADLFDLEKWKNWNNQYLKSSVLEAII